jgi:hypothetical protein
MTNRISPMNRLGLTSILLLSTISACDVPPQEEEPAALQQELRGLFTEQLIDFDSATYQSPLLGPITIFFGDGEIMDSAYAHMGVNFSCVVCASGHAYARNRGGNLGVSLFPYPLAWPYGGAYDARSGAVEATFDTPRAWVSIEATAVASLEGLGPTSAKPWIEAYDVNNTLIARTYHTGTAGAREVLQVNGSIKRVRFSSQSSGAAAPPMYGAFDNLRFNADPWRPIVVWR